MVLYKIDRRGGGQARNQDFFFLKLGLFLRWYMVFFITLSMYAIKTNLFNKCILAFKGFSLRKKFII